MPAHRRHRAFAIAVPALAAIVVAVGLPAAPAEGAPGGDATPTHARLDVDPGSPAEISAMCPAGRRATGGGFSLIDDLLGPGGGAVEFGGLEAVNDVEASGPVDETGQPENTQAGDVARGWYVRVAGSQGSADYIVTVLCSATSDSVVSAAPLEVPAGLTQSASVACPAGRATGGGVLPVGSSAGAVMRTTQPLDSGGIPVSTASGAASRAWFASVGSTGATAFSYRVLALCSATSDAIITTAAFPGIAGETTETGRGCADDLRTTGGGAGAGDPGTVTLRYAGPAGPDVPERFSDFWEVQVSSAAAQALTGYVVCATYDPGPSAGGPAGPGAPGSGGGAGPGAGPSGGTTGAGAAARCAGQKATKVGTARADTIRGTSGRDVIVALGGDDVVLGLGGNDLLCLGAGADRADGGRGADRIIGEAGADRIAGGRGADQLVGGAGRDLLLGGLGADRLTGGGGGDTLRGGAGRNTLAQ